MSGHKKPSSTPTNATYLHSAFDDHINCRYILFVQEVGSFLKLVKSSYEDEGAIEGQREAVRTATATRIRRRLVDDLKNGAIIPPIVVGAVVKKADIKRDDWDDASLTKLLDDIGDAVSIIDGMQRTTALLEIPKDAHPPAVRVELWLAESTENLIYRMLVLNTGQIPWNLRRQLEVVHRGLISEIAKSLDGTVTIYRADDKRRRTDAGEFQANDVVEMYLAFKLRKPHVDKESVLSDQFSKLDLIESVSAHTGLSEFLEAFRQLVELDRAFSRATENKSNKKFPAGRSIFDKVSACAGCVSAYAQYVKGKVGMDRAAKDHKSHSAKAIKNVAAVVNRLNGLSGGDVRTFLALDTLAEVSEKKGGALSIGEAERELFLSAFRLLFQEGDDLTSMEPCWRSQ